jgi:hypothetical protein
MTAPQKHYYWRLWNDVCSANLWRTRKGRFEHDPERLNAMGGEVMAIAARLAADQHRAITEEDLRHAAHIRALGHDKSSKTLTNSEFNLLIPVLQLLVEWNNVQALMDLANAENAQRRSFIAFLLKRAPEATLIAIARNAFDTVSWRDLPLPKLRWLSGELKDREAKWNPPFPAHPLTGSPAYPSAVSETVNERELDSANAPF